MDPHKSKTEAGFTLVEVAIAVAILGLALTTLVGLHTRMLDTYYLERNRTKASLAAQYLMTLTEVAPDPPEVGSTEGDLNELLDERGYYTDLDDTEVKNSKEQLFNGWRYTYEVHSIDLPLIEDALRRIDLVLIWGEGEDERYNLSYFMNVSKAPEQNGAGAANPFAPSTPSVPTGGAPSRGVGSG